MLSTDLSTDNSAKSKSSSPFSNWLGKRCQKYFISDRIGQSGMIKWGGIQKRSADGKSGTNSGSGILYECWSRKDMK